MAGSWCDVEGLDELIQDGIVGVVQDMANARSVGVAGYMFHDSSSSNLAEEVHEAARGAGEGCAFEYADVEEADKKVGEHAAQGMHLDFLIGPVVLGTQGEMERVLEDLEGLLYVALATIRQDDLRYAPVVPVGNQDAPTEMVIDKLVVGLRVNPRGESILSRLSFLDVHFQYLADPLPAEDTSDLLVEPVPVAAPRSRVQQGLAERGELLLAFLQVLVQPTDLAFS